ncbi:MAG: CaiB/BaiF CoA-transferase family protein [Candidatus Acidiferrum sp.]
MEMTEALAGPYCGMLLGDFGADVIKVERRGKGDQARGWGPPFVGGESAYFLATNRNKRSITLDYDDPRGAEVLRRLLQRADVFLTNQPSLESLKRRGIDPATLETTYPRLIHCSITGYGFTGPKAGRPGYDILAQAEAGLMSFTGEPDGGPMRFPIAMADMTCGMYSMMGILAALFSRERTGRGEFLDMALLDSQLTWLANAGSSYLNAKHPPKRWGNQHPNIVPYQVFRGSDDRHFVVGVGTEALWRKFVKLAGMEKFGNEERFASNALRIKHRTELVSAIQEVLGGKPSSEWLDALLQANIPAASINTAGEALSDAQTIARGMIVQLEHSRIGTVRSIGNPVKFSNAPVSFRLPPPMLGEHTEEILRSLGCGEEEVRNYKSGTN